MSELWYQDPATLQAELKLAGSWAELSRRKGVPVSTLKHWGQRVGMQAKPKDNETVDEKLVRENELLRLENKRLRTAAKEHAQADLELERVLNRIDRAAQHAGQPVWAPVEFETQSAGKRTSQEAVLLWSDLHAAEVVSLEETRGINQYNWKIMVDRMDAAQKSIFSHTDHFGFRIEKLTIAMLGDMLSGNIHEELAETNDRPLAEAVVDLAYEHIPWLLAFADYFPQVHIAGVPGNHPRSHKKPRAKQAHDNADWLFYQFLHALLENHPQFTFDIPRGGFNVIQIAERWRALLMHGDGIRTSMPGVPWGGVVRRITQLESQFMQNRQPLDFVMLGHFHTRNALDGVSSQVFLNGSLKGADEYSLKAFGAGRPASQSLMTFHPKRGWTGSYAINLQDNRPGSEGW